VPGFFVQNFGCRATQADGASIERQLVEKGLDRAASANEADLVVLNTCTVTAAADQDARAAIRRVHRTNPEAKILVTGCYAQRAPEEIAALPGVTWVVGNSHKQQIPQIATSSTPADFVSLESVALSGPAFTLVGDIFAHTELVAAPVFDAEGIAEKTRPNLKVQDGCNNRCSFCIIPSVRGQSRSMKLDRVLEEAHALVAAGYREIVLSGINLGRWGRDLDHGLQASDHRRANASNSRPPTFEDLLRAILDETKLEKLRISSVEPMDWTDELIALVVGSPRIAKHAHVPLQSGSDAVLRRMHRKYRPWHYRQKIEKIHAATLTAAIGADVMTGFPGETDAEFETTRRLIEDLPFTYLHVFTYSARPGTPAATMPNQVPVHVARERNKILRDLAAGKKQRFMQSFVGKKLEAITLNNVQNSPGAYPNAARPNPLAAGGQRGEIAQGTSVYTEALTDNYQKLILEGLHAPNRWIIAHIEEVKDGALLGTLG
jgi:threonylcarbamoyladenosine tRNA methylthiotransferase MtaB